MIDIKSTYDIDNEKIVYLLNDFLFGYEFVEQKYMLKKNLSKIAVYPKMFKKRLDWIL